MESVEVLSTTIKENNSGTTQHIMNGRAVCQKQANGCNCLDLDEHEVCAAAVELGTLVNAAKKAGKYVLVVSVGGANSDKYVKLAALSCPCFVGGTHASTWVVRYPFSWDTKDAQIAASHKCINAMGKFFFQHALTSTPTALFFNMCDAPNVGMVQSGTDPEVLDKAAVAHSAHCSKLGTAGAAKLHEKKDAAGKSVHTLKLHKEKNAVGQSLHAVKMGTAGAAALHKEKNAVGKSVHAVKMGTAGCTTLHKEKNADGTSVAAVKMASKRKYNGHADEETANYQCPNCLKYYVFDSPRDKRGNKRVHQQCGNKAQILVPYHAVH
jgi:hypothetical protein